MKRTRHHGAVDAATLRRRAEDRVKQGALGQTSGASSLEVQRLVHELDVHQAELEIQNEELCAARLDLEASLARYTELFDFAPIGYATVTPDGVLREANHACADVLGVARSGLSGRNFLAFVASQDTESFRALLDRAIGSEKSESCEVALERDQLRGPRHVRLTAALLVRGEPLVLLALEDITERKTREALLAHAEAALREESVRKDGFLATLSHELRNPLAPIRNSLHLLGQAERSSEQSRRALDTLDRQSAYLSRLVDDLLDVTRINHGKVQLQRERIDLEAVVQRTLADYQGSFDRSGVILEGRLPSSPCWVDADPARMAQVLSNLLGNAEKFTPRGGLVTVTLTREGDHATLRVRDTGPGIAPELERHLFEPFAQAPQTLDRTRGGLGLGLAMVKGLVELHGGTVWLVREPPHRGTEIALRLPVAQAPSKGAPSSEPRPDRAQRVLVVDDCVDAADSLRDVLSLEGHEVAVAYDGEQGLALARDFRPDVVLCDLGLPGMDGYAVARAFRADEALRGAFLVALTGYAQPEDRRRAREAGFDEHLAKPPTMALLEQTLARAALAQRGDGPRA